MNPNDQGFYRPDQEQLNQPSVDQTQAVPVAPSGQNMEVNTSVTPVQGVQEGVLSQGADETFVEDELSGQEEDYTGEPITWTAHEFIHREKGPAWYVLFGTAVLVLLVLSVLSQAWPFTVLIVIMVVAIMLISRQPPRELTYSLTDEGLTIDTVLHKFDNYKSFGVIQDGDHYSIMLIPIHRFQPGVSVYFPEESGEEIVDMLGSRLPMKELKLDAIDRIVRLLRL